MKGRIIIAFVLLSLGLADVLDWVSFSATKANEHLDWTSFMAKYVKHLPSFLQPLYQRPILTTGILIMCFVFSGFLFVREKKKVFLVLGIVSFVFAFWQLFSLM